MQKKSKIIVGASVFIIFCISLMTFLWINSQSFKQETANLISKQVENILGTKININSLYIVSTNSAAIDDVEIYDKENELIAKADKVVFTIDFWQILRQSPLAGLSEVDVINPEVNIIQRSDGSWNVEDLIDKDSDTPVDFKGIVKVENGQSKLRFEGKQLSIDKINLEADCADLTAINLDGSLNHEDALVEFDGVVGEVIKTNLEIKAQDLDILKYLPFIPEEYLANVNIKQGFINKANITISGNLENQYTLDGSVSFVDGACEVLGQNVEDIRGIILLNNKYLEYGFITELSTYLNSYGSDMSKLYCHMTGIPIDYQRRFNLYTSTLMTSITNYNQEEKNDNAPNLQDTYADVAATSETDP